MGTRILAVAGLALLIPACGGDSDGGTSFATSTPADGDALGGSEAPFVRIVSPGPRTTCNEGATVNIQAVAIDPDEAIVRVDFFDGTELLGTQWSAPYILAWGGVRRGTHILSAVAVDIDGLSSVSAPVTVVVTDGTGDDQDDDGRHHRRRR